MYTNTINALIDICKVIILLGSLTALTLLSIYGLDYLGIIQAHV